MAAYAALVSLTQVLEQILYPDQQRDDVVVVDHEKEQIKPLHENIIFLLTFLEDFPREAGNFEARITTAANQAEDIIEYHIFDEMNSQYGILSEHGTHFRNVLSCFRRVKLCLPSTEPASHQIVVYTGLKHHNWQSLYRKLHESIAEIDSILKEVMQIKSSSRSKDLRSSHSCGSSSSSSRLAPKGKDTVVGFQEDLIKIKDRLCGGPPELQIIPIVGMGGIGKTTLARYAHDDRLIVEHFDFRAWVTVSQDYHARRVLLGLLYSVDASNKEQYEAMKDEKLEEHVFKYLKGRRYLIVMDDMWNTNAWDDVQRILPNDFNGSRVIITTRELDVASYAGSSSHSYQMQLMDVDQSWGLLREKVFGQVDCPPGLEKIGKLIAKNCRGLPLAIVVIAGVLSKVNKLQYIWEDIATNVNKAVNTSDEQFLEILSLSYTHLPHYLRPCFLYMGGFPEDYEIKVSELIKYWVAEGFLKSNGSKDLEEVAEEYLEELARRSLILVIKKRSDGKIKAVKIHDLLRDLCLKKARDENFLQVIKKVSSSFIHNSCRLSIILNTWDAFPEVFDSPTTRTILLFHYSWGEFSWKSFRLLRVMDAMGVKFKSYPVEIGELFHLRYLAFAFGYTRSKFEVPGSLTKLQNLQTLILAGCSNFSLPLGIWRMPQLRHLILLSGFLPDPRKGTFENFLALENLHTLSGVTGFTCSQRIFKMIPNVKKLGIIYSVGDLYKIGWSKYCLKNLVHLHKLEKLKFQAEPYGQRSLPRNIAFPRTLKKLTLRNCGIKWKDMQNIVGPLPNLEVLKLKEHACHGFEWETTEGGFRGLKLLVIDRAVLSHWITEGDHFPILERLLLYDCHKLREIPRCIGDIPTLQLIEVDSALVKSAKCIREEQRGFGNDDLQVHLLKSRP